MKAKKKEAEMTDEEFMDNMNYGIIAVKGNSVVHFCGYVNKPSEEEFAALDEELQSDPEFHLIGEDYDLYMCPEDLFEQIMHDFHIKKEAGEINWVNKDEEDEEV